MAIANDDIASSKPTSVADKLPEGPASRDYGAKIRQFLQTLGPGLVTGASDDDPSGIATYSQVGAQFGLV